MSIPYLSEQPVQRKIRSPLKRYGLALIFVVVAVALRTWFEPVMGQQSFAFFLGAILLGAWFGGIGPAIMCLLLLHFIHAYWFAVPRGLWQPTMASIVSTSAYYLVGITFGILIQMRSSAQRQARDQQL